MADTIIPAGTWLHTGDAWTSGNRQTIFGLADDKLFRQAYTPAGQDNTFHAEAADFIEWGGGRAVKANLYNNGNFAILDESGKALWQTWTAGNDGANLVVQDDGNVVIRAGDKTVWSWHDSKDLQLFFLSARW